MNTKTKDLAPRANVSELDHIDYSAILSAAQYERGQVVADWFSRTSKAIAAAVGRMRRRRLLRDQLMALDNHMLADIGITRGDITRIVNGEYVGARSGNDNAAKAA